MDMVTNRIDKIKIKVISLKNKNYKSTPNKFIIYRTEEKISD